ncbi:MAG: hypothetical protein ACUVRK_02840 [Spirochaetota bacterium]
MGKAVAGWLLTNSENDREEVENAYRFVAHFFGITIDELYDMPCIKDHIAKDEASSMNHTSSVDNALHSSMLIQNLYRSRLNCCKVKIYL